jgi:hypothetical protein
MDRSRGGTTRGWADQYADPVTKPFLGKKLSRQIDASQLERRVK